MLVVVIYFRDVEAHRARAQKEMRSSAFGREKLGEFLL